MFLIVVYNSHTIKVNLQKKHFCHAKIFQTMTPFIMFFMSFGFSANRVASSFWTYIAKVIEY
jgi:hypothetical protein